MDNQKRLLLAVGLSLGLTLVYSKLVWEPQAAKEREAAELLALTADAGTTVAAAEAANGGSTIAALLPPDTGGRDAGGARAGLPMRELKFARTSALYTFSTEGAGLTHAVLQGKKEREQQEVSLSEGYKKLFGGAAETPPQMDLAKPVDGHPLPFAVSINGASPVKGTSRYEVVEERDGHIVFRTAEGPWEIEKTFTWQKDGYELGMQVVVKNVGTVPLSAELGLHSARAIDPAHEVAPSMFGGVGNQSNATCHLDTDVHRKMPSNDPPEEFKGALHYAGIDQQYFLSSFFPVGAPLTARCVLTATATARLADAFFPITVAPGEKTTLNFGGFLGPKDFDVLAATVGVPAATGGPNIVATYTPALEKSVDFGWWAVICNVLLKVLKLFHTFTGNWGVAIILLTVGVKVLLLPLTHKAMVSAESMKKLQPKMEELKKKFPDDKERQNVEMMKMYQEQKVNPLGGCLPLLLQLPVWAALFTTLRTSYELYGEPFFGPVWTDLTYKDPTYILPLALGVTMIITQRLQPQMMDATQAKIMTWFMPIFFTAIMMNYPAGLALYIFTNNLLSIAQQAALKRYLARSEEKKKDDKKLAAVTKA